MDPQQRQGKMFGNSEDEEEISDLDGDQVSDNEYSSKQVHEDEPESSQNNDEMSKSITKLPSFKKKSSVVDTEESARLEEVRRELRELKNNREREEVDEEDEKPLDPQQALKDEIDRHFEQALKGGKKKRKKQDGEDLENSIDDNLEYLKDKMQTAASQDADANEAKRAATHKIEMLSEVRTMLTNKLYHDAIFENGLLSVIRVWLEPLPDRSLPSLDIQSEMLDILDKLPISGDHLRESGVGKIVFFYTKSPRIEPSIKRKADQLVGKWSRLVIKRKKNSKDRRPATQEYRQEDMIRERKRYRRPAEDAEEVEKRHFVRVPQAVAADYDVAPQNNIRLDKNRSTRPDNTFRRLNNTMRSIKTGPKRTTPKVSIEGKGMSF